MLQNMLTDRGPGGRNIHLACGRRAKDFVLSTIDRKAADMQFFRATPILKKSLTFVLHERIVREQGSARATVGETPRGGEAGRAGIASLRLTCCRRVQKEEAQRTGMLDKALCPGSLSFCDSNPVFTVL
jgi:hypothetical protein